MVFMFAQRDLPRRPLFVREHAGCGTVHVMLRAGGIVGRARLFGALIAVVAVAASCGGSGKHSPAALGAGTTQVPTDSAVVASTVRPIGDIEASATTGSSVPPPST